MIKVLIAAESSLLRQKLAESLSILPFIDTLDRASNGKIALDKMSRCQYDLLILDIELSVFDGLTVLEKLKTAQAKPAVIMLSGKTTQAGQKTMQALQNGAIDFIIKPAELNPEYVIDFFREKLAPLIKSLAFQLSVHGILHGSEVKASVSEVKVSNHLIPEKNKLSGINNKNLLKKPTLIVIGCSTGGPNALEVLLPELPDKLGAPILIVQHMPPFFTKTLAETLSKRCALKVIQAENEDIIENDCVYIAPGGHQMRLVSNAEGKKVVQITDDPPENCCRPSVDYLFRSVAENFPGQALGIILTGMGSDGTIGLRLLKENGCFVIAQDEASSVVFGMPKAAIEAGVVDMVMPINSIATQILKILKGETQ